MFVHANSISLRARRVISGCPLPRFEVEVFWGLCSVFRGTKSGAFWYGVYSLSYFLLNGLSARSKHERSFITSHSTDSRIRLPSFAIFLRSTTKNKGSAKFSDLGSLLNANQNDSRLGFPVVSFVCLADSLGE